VRFGWSGNVPLPVYPTAAFVWVLGFALISWAMASNRFFSTVVRIQQEREHAVVTAGPYQYVRHPGYVGFTVMMLVTPLLLGSWWALIPVACAIVVIIVRTALEDRTLQTELAGYSDYAQRVRYRLLPGVW
jgi:protein-S-isoprenylcysteine O-methyltransferase Ste14